MRDRAFRRRFRDLGGTLSRFADTLRACRRGTASNSPGPKARGKEWRSGDSADNWLCVPAPAAPQRRRSDAERRVARGPRTPRCSEAWSRPGETGRANEPSTAALAAATPSSFTGNLRAARCVGRHAGRMPSGGLSRSYPTSQWHPQHSRTPPRAFLRQQPASRSATFARVKPEHRSKNDAEGGARAAHLPPGRKAGSSPSSPRCLASSARCATSTPSGNGWRREAYRSRRNPR